MKDLKPLTLEDIATLTPILDFTPAENEFWDQMTKEYKKLENSDDVEERIKCYMNKLPQSESLFPGRITVKRNILYQIGYAYELLATHIMKEQDPLLRAEMFEKAVEYYQAADETVGFLTDYALRQAESCGGAATCRLQAGLKDETTQAYTKRAKELIVGFFAGIAGNTNVQVTIINGPMPKEQKLLSEKISKPNDVADAYIQRGPENPQTN